MKPQWTCRHARAGDRITKPTCGNTVAPEEAWCSTSAWVEDGTDRSSFWDSSRAFSKPTAMQRMTKSVGREWCMPLVGLIIPIPALSRHGPPEALQSVEIAHGCRD